VGMVLAVDSSRVEEVLADLSMAGETAFTVGSITEGAKGCTVRGSAGTWSAKGDWKATHNG